MLQMILFQINASKNPENIHWW